MSAGNLPPPTPMGTKPLSWFGGGRRSHEERIEAVHTRGLPSFGPHGCVKPYCCFVVWYCVLARERVVLQYTRAAGETEREWPPLPPPVAHGASFYMCKGLPTSGNVGGGKTGNAVLGTAVCTVLSYLTLTA